MPASGLVVGRTLMLRGLVHAAKNRHRRLTNRLAVHPMASTLARCPRAVQDALARLRFTPGPVELWYSSVRGGPSRHDVETGGPLGWCAGPGAAGVPGAQHSGFRRGR